MYLCTCAPVHLCAWCLVHVPAGRQAGEHWARSTSADAGSQPLLAQASMNGSDGQTVIKRRSAVGGQVGRRVRGLFLEQDGQASSPHNLPGVLQPPWAT